MKFEELKKLEADGKLLGKFDVDINTYHQNLSPGISKSDLDLIHNEPYLYQQKKILGLAPEEAPSKALEFGKMFHEACLEPEVFTKYVSDEIFSGINKRTNAGKAEIENWSLSNPDKILVDKKDYDLCLAMRDSVLSIDIAKTMLTGSSEESYYWINQDTSLLCKCRPDCVKIGKRSYITELKTTNDINGFERNMDKLRYHVQATHCLEGIQAVTHCNPDDLCFIFVAVNKTYPYSVRLLMLDQASLLLGDKIRLRDLKKLKKCIDTGIYPKKCELKNWGVPEIETITLPNYAFYNEEFGDVEAENEN